MSTRAIFVPGSAELPTSLFPALSVVNNRPVLAFDATNPETSYWTMVAPMNFPTGNITAVASFIMASANTGNLAFDAAIEAITPGDAIDLDTSTSFANVSTGSANVPATAGNLGSITWVLSNTDNVAAGDYMRISLTRNTTLDTATGDGLLLTLELRDAA